MVNLPENLNQNEPICSLLPPSTPSGWIQNAAKNSDGVGSEAIVLASAPGSESHDMCRRCVDMCRSVSNFPKSMFEEGSPGSLKQNITNSPLAIAKHHLSGVSKSGRGWGLQSSTRAWQLDIILFLFPRHGGISGKVGPPLATPARILTPQRLFMSLMRQDMQMKTFPQGDDWRWNHSEDRKAWKNST